MATRREMQQVESKNITGVSWLCSDAEVPAGGSKYKASSSHELMQIEVLGRPETIDKTWILTKTNLKTFLVYTKMGENDQYVTKNPVSFDTVDGEEDKGGTVEEETVEEDEEGEEGEEDEEVEEVEEGEEDEAVEEGEEDEEGEDEAVEEGEEDEEGEEGPNCAACMMVGPGRRPSHSCGRPVKNKTKKVGGLDVNGLSCDEYNCLRLRSDLTSREKVQWSVMDGETPNRGIPNPLRDKWALPGKSFNMKEGVNNTLYRVPDEENDGQSEFVVCYYQAHSAINCDEMDYIIQKKQIKRSKIEKLLNPHKRKVRTTKPGAVIITNDEEDGAGEVEEDGAGEVEEDKKDPNCEACNRKGSGRRPPHTCGILNQKPKHKTKRQKKEQKTGGMNQEQYEKKIRELNENKGTMPETVYLKVCEQIAMKRFL